MRYVDDYADCKIELIGDHLRISIGGHVANVPVIAALDLLRKHGYTYDDIPCKNGVNGTRCSCRQCKSKCGAV